MRSLFAERIRQWLLTLRKQNAAVVLVAHSAAQVAALENRHLLVESCPTRVFLPNADALEPEAARHYEGLGLNAAEVEIVARARRKRDYYVTGPAGSRLFSLGLGPAALTFLTPGAGRGQGEAVRTADDLAAEHGDGWPAELLRLRGHPNLATDFEQCHRRRAERAAEDAQPARTDPILVSS
jgi:type IV secretion system protein VirB4